MKVHHGHPATRLARRLRLALSLSLALVSTAGPLSAETPITSPPPTPHAARSLDARHDATMTPPAASVAAVAAVAGTRNTQSPDLDLLREAAQAMVQDGSVPGLAIAVVQDGKVLMRDGFGVTDVDAPRPVGAHTVFRMASLSKAFAGTLTGLLVHDGRLRWDSRVRDYVPGFAMIEPSAAERVTVADVLSQRTGLKAHTFDRDLEADVAYPDLVQRLASAPMQCEPGQCYGYQNVAFSLVGDVIDRIEPDGYASELRRRVFTPLGMRDASVGLDALAASPSWARPHQRDRSGWRALYPKPNYYRVTPAAGVNASISDLAQWLLAQGGHRPDVLPAPLLATLHTPLVQTPEELNGIPWRRARLLDAGYAIGWRVYDYAGHTVIFHAGAVQGYRAMIALLPEQDFGMAVLWNAPSATPSGLLPTMLDHMLGLGGLPWFETPGFDYTAYEARRHANGAAGMPDTAVAAPR